MAKSPASKKNVASSRPATQASNRPPARTRPGEGLERPTGRTLHLARDRTRRGHRRGTRHHQGREWLTADTKGKATFSLASTRRRSPS